MPAFLDTGLNMVDVRDVARGHVAACCRGKVGERYILGSENLTLEGIFGILEEITGTAGAEDADSLRRGAGGRGGIDGVGQSNRQGAFGSSGRRTHGEEEDVGEP